MMDVIVATGLIGALVAGPLAWRARKDRREDRALAIRATLQRVVNDALGGESLLTVQVVPATLGRRGKVVLYAPAHWEWLIDEAWRPLHASVPAGYDLVVEAPAPEVVDRSPVALTRAA
jgi:hypothetical protein